MAHYILRCLKQYGMDATILATTWKTTVFKVLLTIFSEFKEEQCMDEQFSGVFRSLFNRAEQSAAAQSGAESNRKKQWRHQRPNSW